jgi:hypothetical protein
MYYVTELPPLDDPSLHYYTANFVVLKLMSSTKLVGASK